MTVRSLGLRARLTVLVLVIGSAVAAIALAGLTVALDRQLDAAVTDELRARAREVAAQFRGGRTGPLADPFAQVIDRSGEVTSASAAAPPRALLTGQQLAVARSGVLTVEEGLPELRGTARLYARPLDGAVVVVGAPIAQLQSATRRFEAVLTGLLAVVALGSAAVTWLVVGGALRPVRRLVDAADAISGHGDVARLPVPPSRDEIAGLATTLNRLLDRLAASFARESAFVDDASHDLRTPLTVLRGELELALDDPDRAGVDRSIRTALGEATRLSELADDLLVLARERSGGLRLDRRETRLLPWAETVLARLQPVVGARLTAAGADVRARVDRRHLERVVVNTVTNAAAAGARQVELRLQPGPTAGTVLLTVVDDGPGFPPGLLASATDRFSRGDPARGRTGATDGGGAGLGLAIAAAIVRAHGGTVAVANDSPLGGAAVTIELPGDG